MVGLTVLIELVTSKHYGKFNSLKPLSLKQPSYLA